MVSTGTEYPTPDTAPPCPQHKHPPSSPPGMGQCMWKEPSLTRGGLRALASPRLGCEVTTGAKGTTASSGFIKQTLRCEWRMTWIYRIVPTPVMSTPVSACTAGGRVPTSLETSLVVRSCPPISTISSVLASGADTSAAI